MRIARGVSNDAGSTVSDGKWAVMMMMTLRVFGCVLSAFVSAICVVMTESTNNALEAKASVAYA